MSAARYSLGEVAHFGESGYNSSPPRRKGRHSCISMRWMQSVRQSHKRRVMPSRETRTRKSHPAAAGAPSCVVTHSDFRSITSGKCNRISNGWRPPAERPRPGPLRPPRASPPPPPSQWDPVGAIDPVQLQCLSSAVATTHMRDRGSVNRMFEQSLWANISQRLS